MSAIGRCTAAVRQPTSPIATKHDPPAHPGVEVLVLPAEDANGSVVRAQKPDQAPERGGLARPVSPEKANHTALRNREVQPAEGVHLAESLPDP